MDDEAVYRQMRQGDEAALAELVARYHTAVYRFLYRYTGDPALADDLAQEAFIRLVTYRGDAPVHFRAWIYTIATNLARDHFQSAAYRHEQAVDFETDEPSADDSLPESADVDVTSALMSLPPAHREVIILRFYHDLKLDEIAAVTGAPLGTVKSRLFHALKRLKGFLAVMEIDHDRR
ncbi:MAG: sigma-70 family RNA polymerase sigma factor [Anaerolineae bacterium]|nr:sigma-70 family RNA polymerase sigma factor [Anaerolineae bacterium]